MRTYIDALIDYTEYSKIEEANAYYGSLRMLREIIIREQHIRGKQLKLRSFFAPHHPRQSTKPQPGPSHEHIGGKQLKLSSFFASCHPRQSTNQADNPDDPIPMTKMETSTLDSDSE